MLSFAVSLMWLLAMLAAAALVHDAARSARALLPMGLAFLVTSAVALWFSPQPNWVGVLIGIIAIWRLVGGPFARVGGLLGGVCAGLAAALQVAGGVPLGVAGGLAAGALVIAAALPRAPAGRDMTREIMVIVAALAIPVIGLAADLVYGWHSAAVLNRGAAVATTSPPLWAIGIVALALVAGLIRGLWARR
ncbi:MAG TPA: hypothetical protein VNS79_04060 [Sphingobium sp.]|nr:hypothetical protein [Sphingobium sp.]